MSFTVILRKFKGKNLAHLNTSAFIDELANEALKHARKAKELLEKPTETWLSRPEISYVVLRTSEGIEVQIGTDDNVYRFLNDGTDIRLVVMTADFIPKTTPESFDAGPGQGGVARHVEDVEAMPGIEARGWTGLTYKAINRDFRSGMRNAIARGITRMKEYGG
jgi:hypothetical protein